MKKLLLTTLASLLFINLVSQDSIEGFRGLKWGTHIDSALIEGKKVDFQPSLKHEEAGNYYTRKNEDLIIGTAELESIYYVFDPNNRFFKVLIDGKPESNEDMEYILQQKFGSADGRIRQGTKYMRGWSIQEVDVIFSETRNKDYSVLIESNRDDWEWKQKNTSVDDF